MNLIKHAQLDCQTFAEAVKNKVAVTELEDLTGKVPHVGYGGASKSSYISPNSGKMIFVLERSGMYCQDAFLSDVWQFDTDFSTEEASEFIENWFKEKKK